MKKNNRHNSGIWKYFDFNSGWILLILIASSAAQDVNTWGASAYSSYSQPVGGLKDWFKPAFNFGLSAGKQYNDDWFLEGILEYDHFSQENLNSSTAKKLQLSLEHFGVLFGGRYQLIHHRILQPYITLAAGVFHWIGIRGAVKTDSTVYPFIPPIDERKLEETNWGFRSGAGLEIKLIPDLGIDMQLNYRFIVGDLWPTLQPGIELEGVSGFQTLNYALAIRYYF